MQEAFSLGTGSRTEDLIPEVTALCSICSTNDPEFATFSVEDIECFNKHVFLLQLADGFHLKSRISSSESSVASKDFKNEDFPWYNPFDGTSSESEEMEIMSNQGYIYLQKSGNSARAGFLRYIKLFPQYQIHSLHILI